MTAESLIASVVGHRDAAIGASGYITTCGTLHGRGITTAIEEEHGLFPFFNALLDGFSQLLRKNGNAFFFAGLAAHVNDPNPWHGLVVGASRHFQKTVFAFLSVVIS